MCKAGLRVENRIKYQLTQKGKDILPEIEGGIVQSAPTFTVNSVLDFGSIRTIFPFSI